jgi:excinuclease UvrABC ATPase subunit
MKNSCKNCKGVGLVPSEDLTTDEPVVCSVCGGTRMKAGTFKVVSPKEEKKGK